MGYSPWGCKQSDVTEQFHFHKIGNFHQIMSKFSSAVELFDSPIRPITCANHQDEVHNLASLQPMHSVPMEKVKRLYLSVRFSSVTQSCPTVHPMNCSTLGLPVHHRLPEFTQTHIHLILCRPLLLLPPIPPSIRVFSNESTLRVRWPKYWSFNFSIIPSKEHPGLISFRMDWLDLLAVQGTLRSLL